MTHTSCTSPAAILSSSTDMHFIVCLCTSNRDKLLQYPVTYWTAIDYNCALGCQVLLRCCFHESILALSSISSTRSFSERGALHTQMCTVRQLLPRLREAVKWTECPPTHSQTNSTVSKAPAHPCVLSIPFKQTRQGKHLRTLYAAQLSNGRLMHIAVGTTVSTENKLTGWHKLLRLTSTCCIIADTTDSILQRKPMTLPVLHTC